MLSQIGDALAAAHAAGIVHRDLKPSNLMLTPTGQVKVLDFGIAKVEMAETSTHLTRTGSTVGTAAYMSPEQAEGEAADARADLWSLGVVAYEMLTGRTPFEGTNTLAVIHAVLSVTPPPIRTRRPDVPAELADVVERTLVRDREQRTITAVEIYQLTSACLARLVVRRRSRSSREPVDLRCESARLSSRWQSLQPQVVGGSAATRTCNGRAKRRCPRLAGSPTAISSRLNTISRSGHERTSLAIRFCWNSSRESLNWASIGSEPGGSQRLLPSIRKERRGVEAAGADAAQGRERAAGCDALEGRTGGMTIGGGRRPRTVLGAELLSSDCCRAARRRRAWSACRQPVNRSASSSPALLIFRLSRFLTTGFDHHEVTNREFKRFVDDGGYRRAEFWREPFVKDGRTLTFDEAMTLFRDVAGQSGPATWELGSFAAGHDDYPVGGVSWDEAAAYARWAGKSLPTIYHWNRVADQRTSASVVPASNFGGKSPIAAGTSGGTNRAGASEMAGNVKEWCWNSSGAKRYLLGGAWNEPVYMFTAPDALPPFARAPNYGFRCIKVDRPEDITVALTGAVDPSDPRSESRQTCQ